MNEQRVLELKKWISRDPGDPFCHYALALEYASDKDSVNEAIAILKALLQKHPDYLPAYYQLAFLLKETGIIEESKRIAEQGRGIAIQQNNNHTANELSFLLDDIDY